MKFWTIKFLLCTPIIITGLQLFDPDNSGSGCEVLFQLQLNKIEVNTEFHFVRLEIGSKHTELAGISFDIIQGEQVKYSGKSHIETQVFISSNYFKNEDTYISLYAVPKDNNCQQKPLNYNIYFLKIEGGIMKTEITVGQTACFNFPQETTEVVWPLDSNFQEYCECTIEDLKIKSCNCSESKLFEVIMYEGKICFNVTSLDANRTAIFFQETKYNSCGPFCNVINFLRGHLIDVFPAQTFSFRYDQFYFDTTTANIAWFGAHCSPQSIYYLIQNGSDLDQDLGQNTYISINKTISPTQYYIQAQLPNGSPCGKSDVSLQFPSNVTTKNKIYSNDFPVCVRPSGSYIVMSKEGSNGSCICQHFENIADCSCIQNVGFHVFYNYSSTDAPLCFNNITKNGTRVHFVWEIFNQLSDVISGFPPFIQTILDSLMFVKQSLPLPPAVSNYIHENNSLCFADTFNGYSEIFRYHVTVTDNTRYSKAATHDKKQSTCPELHEIINNQTLENCGDLFFKAKSENEVGNSSDSEFVIHNENEDVCKCFTQNVNIIVTVDDISKNFEVNCDSQYVDFYKNSKLVYQLNQNDEEKKPISVNCSTPTSLPKLHSNFSIDIYWMPDGGSQCYLNSSFVKYPDPTSSSTNPVTTSSSTNLKGGAVAGTFALILLLIIIKGEI